MTPRKKKDTRRRRCCYKTDSRNKYKIMLMKKVYSWITEINKSHLQTIFKENKIKPCELVFVHELRDSNESLLVGDNNTNLDNNIETLKQKITEAVNFVTEDPKCL